MPLNISGELRIKRVFECDECGEEEFGSEIIVPISDFESLEDCADYVRELSEPDETLPDRWDKHRGIWCPSCKLLTADSKWRLGYSKPVSVSDDPDLD